jgi:hypothetical protein
MTAPSERLRLAELLVPGILQLIPVWRRDCQLAVEAEVVGPGGVGLDASW